MHESFLFYGHHDLITPDGKIVSITSRTADVMHCTAIIENIGTPFIGYLLAKEQLSFNLKSTLAQIGIDAKMILLYLYHH